MAWLNGWIYRKQVNITGQSGAGTLYQVELSIGASASGDFHLQNHCINFPQDIRFTDNDGETLLDYWVEDLTADPIKVWVKVADDLGSNQSIYCYYGKSGESSGSNGTNTFEFFDDFESVEDNWTSRSNASQSSEEAYEGTYSGKLCLSAGVYGNLIKTWTTSPIILEWASKLHSTGEVNRMFWGGNRNGKNYLIGMNESNTYAQVVDTTVHDTNVPKDYEWHTYKIVFSATDIKFYIDGILKHTTESAPSLTEWRFYGGHGVSYHDIVRVRKYASPEPAFATAGDEESVSFMEIIEILDSHDETLTNEGEIEKDTVIIPIGKKNDKYYIYAVSLKIPPNLYYKDLINLKIKAQVRTAHGSAQITVVKLSENSITDIFERTWHEVWSTITEKEFGTYGDSLSFAQSTGLKTFYLNANALENLRAAVDFANLTGDYVYWTLGFRLDEDDPTFYIELEDASAFIFSNADEQVMSNSDLKVKTLGANNPAVFLNIDTPQKIGETIFCTPMLKFSEIKKVIQTTINYSDSMASIRAFAESFNISCTYFLERTGFYQNSGRTITHSLGLGTYLVALISTADWNADIGEIYIASLLTNSFTIYNSGAGKSSFSWLIFDNPYELGDSTFNGSGGQTVNHSKGDTNYVPYIIPSADGDGAIGEWWITDYANTSFMVRNSGSAVTTLKWAIARYNNGSKGSSSFAGSSGVTITHNLGIADYTPLIIPTVDPGGQLGAVYVTDITTNSFIVRNTGSAITAFDWIIPDMKAITDNSLFKTYIKKTSESLQLNIERVFNIWKKIARYLSFTVTSLIYEHFPLANSFQITEDTIKSTPTKRPNETVNFDIAKKSTIKVKISEVFQSSISILAYEALKLAESFSSGIDITKKSFNKFLQTVIDITSQPIDLSKATIFAHFEEAFHSVINLTKSQVVYHLSEGFSTTVNIAKVVLEKKISEILEMTQILKKAAILIKNEGFSLMEKSWSHYDYGAACGVDLDGYYGAEFDGRYVYFVPYQNDSGYFGDVMRYDTQGDFTNINSWSHYDYGAACGVDLDGYRGAEFDGRYVYFVPCDNGYDYFGDVMRYDTERDFTKNIKLKKSILKSLSETLNNSISLIKNINLILSEKISSLLLFSQYEFAKFEEAFHVLENLAKTAIKIDIENFSIVCTVSRVWTRKLIENINLTFLNKKTFFTTKIGNLAINIDKKIKIRGLLGRIKISSKTRNLILKRKVPDKKIKLRIDKRKIELNK